MRNPSYYLLGTLINLSVAVLAVLTAKPVLASLRAPAPGSEAGELTR